MSKITERREFRRERIRRSLNIKTFFITMLLTFGIGGTVLVAGFLLYLTGVGGEFMRITWNQANAGASVLEQMDSYQDKCQEILKIYDSIPEEERGDGRSDAYHAKFDHVIDQRFRELQRAMLITRERNDSLNAFIVALDTEKNRMIYLVDSDQNQETFCWPGTWEDYPESVLDDLINGKEPTEIEKRRGNYNRMQVSFTNQPGYGRRCTGGATLDPVGRYTVMICVDEKLDPLINISKVFLLQYVVLLFIVTTIAAFIGMLLIRRNMVKPINRMAVAAEAYGEDEEKYIGGTRYFNDLQIRTGDEIENLALTLQYMESDLAEHMENLTHITAERERISTELDLAYKIQNAMLPLVFPAFPDRTEFDIYASMEPAKEVGGDFYDFFLIDDDHLAVEIADVSGKGIPAALFMVASKILLADKAMEGLPPAKILEAVNERISQNNELEMFVTVWLGILEISTGKLVAANAGHEYPIIIHSDGTVEVVHDKHGFVIGGLGGMKYTEYEIQMQPGDRIFVYTDGVTEATSKEQELFGMTRMEVALSGAENNASPQEILAYVHAAVEDFVGEEEQFDDLTMLCLEYKGMDKAPQVEESEAPQVAAPAGQASEQGAQVEELRLPAKVENLPQVMEFLDTRLEANDCPMKIQMQIELAVEEIFVNIASYAYGEGTGDATIRMEITEGPTATITISDQGTPYDPLKRDDPDLTLSAEERDIGGLGVYLTKETMDEVSYEYADGSNVLTLKKLLK